MFIARLCTRSVSLWRPNIAALTHMEIYRNAPSPLLVNSNGLGQVRLSLTVAEASPEISDVFWCKTKKHLVGLLISVFLFGSHSG